MFGIALKLFGAAVAIVVVVFAAAASIRSARRLDRRIRDLELEEAEKIGPRNPYADMAELYADDARKRTR